MTFPRLMRSITLKRCRLILLVADSANRSRRSPPYKCLYIYHLGHRLMRPRIPSPGHDMKRNILSSALLLAALCAEAGPGLAQAPAQAAGAVGMERELV